MAEEHSVDAFNRDVDLHQGYVYTTSDRPSCRLSNARISQAVLELAEVEDLRVIDIGCGDGTYTLDFVRAGAREVLGVDAAAEAIARAREKTRELANLGFEVVDIYDLASHREPFDVAVVRGLLHHLYRAREAVEQIAKIAHRVVVVEPNGYNPVLKIIEKVSPYHRRHEEKSYRPDQLDRWFEACGGRVERSLYIGLVPFFCPDALARFLKSIEPAVEGTPLLRSFCCGQYVQRIVFPG